MSEERLEEIAYNVGISLDGEKALMSSDDYDFLYNYALQQAERVQELEEENERLCALNIATTHELNHVDKINKRYREALEFYANKINYLTFIENGKSNIEHDQGEKARKALGGDLE